MLFRFVVAETQYLSKTPCRRKDLFVSQLQRSQSTRVGRVSQSQAAPARYGSRNTEREKEGLRCLFSLSYFYSLSVSAYGMVLLTFRINPFLKHLHQHTQRCALLGISYILLSPVIYRLISHYARCDKRRREDHLQASVRVRCHLAWSSLVDVFTRKVLFPACKCSPGWAVCKGILREHCVSGMLKHTS